MRTGTLAFRLLLAIGATAVIANPASANGKDPGVTSPGSPGGDPNDFHMLTLKPIVARCFFILLCDRDIPTDPWGSQKKKNVLTPDGYLNSWAGEPPLGPGGKLTFGGVTITKDLKVGSNLIVDSYWTLNGEKLDIPVVYFFTNADGQLDMGKPGELAIAAVPEPDRWLLLIAGFGLIGAAVRRRRSDPLPA